MRELGSVRLFTPTPHLPHGTRTPATVAAIQGVSA